MKRAVREKWAIYTLRQGLGSLPRAMHAGLLERGVQVQLGQACTALTFAGDKVKVCESG